MKALTKLIIGGVATVAITVGAITSINAQSTTSDYVYICTGNYASAFHAKESCRGLGSCKAIIKKVTRTDAQKAGRKPCKVCKP